LPKIKSAIVNYQNDSSKRSILSKVLTLEGMRNSSQHSTLDRQYKIDGYEVLQARLALQNSIKKTEMLENRIKRLAFE